jgi:UDP-GlcNAc:undecaprenyl-phosphate GlcNAc-1-phosphate transferase
MMLLGAHYALLGVAVAGGAAATFAVRALGRRCGWLDPPNPLVPQHTRAVVRPGGLGLALGAAVALALPLVRPLPPAALLVPAVLFLAVGALDDARRLGPASKLAVQAAAAAAAVTLGLRPAITGMPWADACLATLWIVTLVNACNFVDVCDGLLGGLAALLLLLWAHLHPQQAPFALALAGAALGFLAYNLPPASVFLGDAGAHLLGFALAALTLAGPRGAVRWPYPAEAVLFVALPLFELGFVTGVRLRKRIPWWRGSPDHVALRLQAAGLSRLQTDAALWGGAAVLALAAPALRGLPLWGQTGLLGLAAVACAAAARVLLRFEVRAR